MARSYQIMAALAKLPEEYLLAALIARRHPLPAPRKTVYSDDMKQSTIGIGNDNYAVITLSTDDLDRLIKMIGS